MRCAGYGKAIITAKVENGGFCGVSMRGIGYGRKGFVNRGPLACPGVLILPCGGVLPSARCHYLGGFLSKCGASKKSQFPPHTFMGSSRSQ